MPVSLDGKTATSAAVARANWPNDRKGRGGQTLAAQFALTASCTDIDNNRITWRAEHDKMGREHITQVSASACAAQGTSAGSSDWRRLLHAAGSAG
jgi:hypothetical protein